MKNNKLNALYKQIQPLQKRYAKMAMDKVISVYGIKSLNNDLLRHAIMYEVINVGLPVAFEIAKRRTSVG